MVIHDKGHDPKPEEPHEAPRTVASNAG
jgi:hypothetical protein